MRDNPYKDLPPLDTQARTVPLPHDTGAKETGGQPDTPGVLLL